MSASSRPRKIGKYDIKRRIGKGSMGVVYEGYDPFVQRPVAVKVAQDPGQSDPQQAQKLRELFFSEVYAAGRMHHPNVVSIYDAGQIDGMNFIVMEYIEGSPLSAYTRGDSCLSACEIVDSLYQCATGLEYIHQQGIIHRDLKPANIMRTPEGQIKIMDFSIAHIEMGASLMAAPPGSPMYAPPEQLQEHPELAPQSDIYSLGAVMYTLFTRRPLFRARTLDELTDKILHQDPDPLELLRPDLPGAVIEIVQRCLHKEMDRRYASARELGNALAQLFGRLRHIGQDIEQQAKEASLRRLDFFKDFSDDQIHEITRICDWISENDGVLVTGGHGLEHSYRILVQGELEVAQDGFSLFDLVPGDCFGQDAHPGQPGEHSSLIARGNILLMSLSPAQLDKTRPETQLLFYRKFSENLIRRLSRHGMRQPRRIDPALARFIEEKHQETTCKQP